MPSATAATRHCRGGHAAVPATKTRDLAVLYHCKHPARVTALHRNLSGPGGRLCLVYESLLKRHARQIVGEKDVGAQLTVELLRSFGLFSGIKLFWVR